MVAPTQRDGRRWRGLALTTAAVLGLHWALLDFPTRPTPSALIPGKVLITRQLPERVEPPPAHQLPLPDARRDTERAEVQNVPATKDAAGAAEAQIASPEAARPAPGTPEQPPSDSKAAPPQAAEANATVMVPLSAALQYKGFASLRGQKQEASGRLIWKQDGDRYSASLETKSTHSAARRQSSEGRIGADGLAPDRYSDSSKSELAVHFQRERRLITFSANAPSVPLLEGAQDHVSVVLQLSGLLSGNTVLRQPGARIPIQTASSRQADVWIFDVVDEGSADGYANLHLRKVPVRTFDETLDLWLSPRHGYLPARLKFTYANGDFLELEWVPPDQ